MEAATRLGRRVTRLQLAAVLLACGGQDPAPEPQSDALPDSAMGSAHEYAYLEDEVRHLVEFLRGNAQLRSTALADTVTFYIAPEGGGEQRSVSAGELQTVAAWRLGPYSLVPAAGLSDLRMTPGLHSNCFAMPLETRFPELARDPHVGVRLARPEAESCLQTWNATFVFNDDAEAPRLTAVVYDQWEW